MSGIFPLSGCRIMLHAAAGGGGITFHIWRKQMLHFFAAFPRCHCFRFHLREASRLHTHRLSFLFCLSLVVCWFLFCYNHGRHRGSQPEPAAPERPSLGSPEQRVRLLQERNAAHCWSGKKWPVQRRSLNVFWNKWKLCHCSAKCAQKSNRAAFFGYFWIVF